MKKNWVLIRGLARGVGHWTDFPEALKTAFPNDNFEFLEVPGNGSLYKEKSPLSVTEMLESIRQQSQFIQQQQKVNIIAISLGGMIATAWASQHPSEVEQLVLINSSSAKHSKFYERLRPKNYLKMAEIFISANTGKSIQSIEQEILAMTANSSERRAFALPHWTKESEAHPIQMENFFRQLLAASKYQFPLVPPTKTTIFASENDHFVSANCSKSLASSWGCKLHLHPWAGHDLPLDDSQWVIDQLRQL